VVLVRNWSGSSWSWPKGKINEGESPFSCGLRETFEETGYNAAASGLCSEDAFLVVHEDSKLTKLFVAVGE
jgi:mRNA-decapping enzyme subunit 2